MSIQKIPNELKQIVQSNVGDYRGNLWSTFNIDLDSNPGTIRASKRLQQTLGLDEIGTDTAQALQLHDGRYYLATNNKVFSCSVTSDPRVASSWIEISTLSDEDLGFETDMTSFNGLLLASLGTDIMSWDGSTKNEDWWTTLSGSPSALTADFTHTLEVLRTGNDTLFVTDKNKVRYYNTEAGATIITLDPFMISNCLTPSLDRMWVGTYTDVENNAYVYEIQVGNDIATQSYEIEGRVCLAMFTYKNTPFVITDRGYIQAFNGAGFETVAQFPWATESKAMAGCRPGQVQASPTSRAIHPKGARVSGSSCFINVNTRDGFDTSVNLSNRAPSGVWVLDLQTYSLNHRYSLTENDTDYGVSKVGRSGAVLITNTPETRVIVAGDAETEGIWTESDATPLAYFTTTRQEPEEVMGGFEKVVIHSDTLDANESIELKHKDTHTSTYPHTVNSVTWLNESQFTTTDAMSGISAGDEVAVLEGLGAGDHMVITSIAGDTTKTITVDSTFGVQNSTSDIQVENWKVIKRNTSVDQAEAQTYGASATAASRQHKVILRGNVTIRRFTSKSSNKTKL